MARARNIKPGFFINEDLVELPFSTRLLFIGLWTIADRAGRLEDRPRKIKMAIFPADDVDVEKGLAELHGAGMILRYIVDNERFIFIPGFVKHQNPHVNEQQSTIPAPDSHGASMVDATPLTSSLNPSSLNPDSLIVEPNGSKDTLNGNGKKRGTRISPDFTLTSEMLEWASGKPEYARYDLHAETEKFVNYWLGATGAKAVKMDWFATWKNWIANEKNPKLKPVVDNPTLIIDPAADAKEYARRFDTN